MDSEDVSTNNIAGTRPESEVELEMMTDEQIEAKLAVIEKEVERKKKLLKLREAMQENHDLSERMKRPRKDRDVECPDEPQRVGVSGPRGTEEDTGPLTTVRNVNIRDLRWDTRLQDSATRALADLGLPDSDAGWGETQDSSEDSSGGLSCQRKSGKGRKKRTRKHKNSNNNHHDDRVSVQSDSEGCVQWPHENLGAKYNNFGGNDVKYKQLDFRGLIAGELNIISNNLISKQEKQARLKMLGDIVFNTRFYQWSAILKLHAAILSEIEDGVREWGDDYSRLELYFRTLIYN